MSDPKRVFKGTAVADVAADTGLSEPTIYRAIRSGDLKAKKVGRRTIILPEWRMDWLNAMPDARDGMDSEDRFSIEAA